MVMSADDSGTLVESDSLVNIDDICALHTLTQKALLQALHERHAAERYYTRVSQDILVAINPFKYQPEAVRAATLQAYLRAGDESARSLPPHAYAVAREALRQLRCGSSAQAVLVSGESGAGKTETAKLLLSYVAVATSGASGASQGRGRQLEELLHHASDILEAFGNATTVRNGNSSRFSKWLDVHFEPLGGALDLRGCQVTPYILETARVCGPNRGERNFHIFYQLFFSGRFAELGLDRPSSFVYLKDGATSVSHVNDITGFERTCQAFDLFNINQETQRAIFSILGGILMLGNCAFGLLQRVDPSATPGSELIDLEPARGAAQLLGVDSAALIEFLLFRPGFDGLVEVEPQEAASRRDGLARLLYKFLFDWLVSLINRQLRPHVQNAAEERRLGILDIAGFENFETNSLEQLLINLSNEHIQKLFNDSVFKAENEDRAKEGLPDTSGDMICFEDNSDCIELIEERILSTLNDQTSIMLKMRQKKLSASDYVAMVTKKCRSHSRFIAPRFSHGTTIEVNHYAGSIQYSCTNWLEKNAGRPPANADRLLKGSRVQLLKMLGNDIERSNGHTQRGHSHTHSFLTSLKSLMKRIAASKLQFVRCIKPNSESSPDVFATSMVLQQLRCNGILEAVRIRKLGFSNRWTFAEFSARYACLVGHGDMPGGLADQESTASLVGALLRHPQFSELPEVQSNLLVGRTKVLAKATVATVLELLRTRMFDASIVMQRALRGWLGRQHAVALLQVAREAARQRETSEPSVVQEWQTSHVEFEEANQTETENTPSVVVDMTEFRADDAEADAVASISEPDAPTLSQNVAANSQEQDQQRAPRSSIRDRISMFNTRPIEQQHSRSPLRTTRLSGGLRDRIALFGDNSGTQVTEAARVVRHPSNIGDRIALFRDPDRPHLAPHRATLSTSSPPQLQRYTQRQEAERELEVAKRSPVCIETLETAIAEAEASGLQHFKILDAKRLLEREKSKGLPSTSLATDFENATSSVTVACHATIGTAALSSRFAHRRASFIPPCLSSSAPLQKLSQKQEAERELEEAKQTPLTIDKLIAAIANAESAGLQPFKIKDAKRLLEREQRKVKARQALQSASFTVDIEAAIEEAMAAMLSDDELWLARQSLAVARVQEAISPLADAHSSLPSNQDINKLEQLIREAEGFEVEDRLDTAKAAVAKAREQVKAYAREALRSASGSTAIEAAIGIAITAELPDDEVGAARRSLALAQTTEATASLVVALSSTRRAALRILEQRIHGAELLGLHAEIAEAIVVAAQARSDLRTEPCGICLEDEDETDQMPCCARETGSNYICSICLARLLQVNPVCPFCRAVQM